MIRALALTALFAAPEVAFILHGERGPAGPVGDAGASGASGSPGIAANASCLSPEFLRGVQANGTPLCARPSGGLANAVTRTVSIKNADFEPVASTGTARVGWLRDYATVQRTTAGQASGVEAAVHVPDGAVIVGAACVVKDASAQDVSVSLVSRTSGGRTTCATATTSGSQPNPIVLPLPAPSGCSTIAQNSYGGAFNAFSLLVQATHDAAGTWGVFACEVRYSIASALP